MGKGRLANRLKFSRKTHSWAFKITLGFFLIAIIHPFIANEKPLYCVIEGQTYFPVFRSIGTNLKITAPYADLKNYDWAVKNYDSKIMPLVPYSYNTLDKRNDQFKSPFAIQEINNNWQRHWLGTDILGRDVLAGILKGTEIAVKIGFLSVGIAGVIGFLVGFFVAYFRRFPLYMGPIGGLLSFLVVIILVYSIWWGIHVSFIPFVLVVSIITILALIYWNTSWNRTINSPSKLKVQVPIDSIYMRIVEAMKALPTLILLLALVSVFEQISISGLIFILAILMWPGISRYVRAESMKVLSQDYIIAAKALGSTKLRILVKHVAPKVLTSLSVVLAFAISSAVLVESTLSFLGIGLPIEQVSWGSMLKDAKLNFAAWWLAIFPGLALFTLILSLNMLGEKIELESKKSN